MTKHNMLEVVSRLNSPKLRVHAERCLQVRHKNANCLRCAEVCTTGAISRETSEATNGETVETAATMIVAPEKCIGCGTCASVCPTCCLEALNPSDTELEAALLRAGAEGAGRVALACEQALAFAQNAEAQQNAKTETKLVRGVDVPVVGVVCLGRAEESLLVQAAACSFHAITLIYHRCESCTHAPGGMLCRDICASTQSLLDAAASPMTLTRKAAEEVVWTTAPASTPSVAFTALDAETAKQNGEEAASAQHFVHVQADGTLPHVVPSRRLRLFNSLKRLQPNATPTITTRLWGQATINTDLCRSCRMCTVFCPTGALTRFDAARGGFGVEHRTTLCVQCRLCETLCPEQAITVSETVSLSEFISGAKYHFEMQPLGWKPNDTHSIATRMARFFKTEAVQDPQAGVKPSELAAQQAYTLEREARRREIREGANGIT